MVYGIIVAAGKSERIGPNVDKAFLTLGTKLVLAYSLMAFQECSLIDGMILVVRKDRLESARGLIQIFGFSKVKKIVVGGVLRQGSVMNGLAELHDEVRIVAVHDGARPCVTPDLIAETVKSAKRFGSGVAAVKITDTVKEADRGLVISRTVDRAKLWAVQTPQTFKRELLIEALRKVEKSKATVTDEAAAMELIDQEVHLVPSTWANIKITVPEDIPIAAAMLKL